MREDNDAAVPYCAALGDANKVPAVTRWHDWLFLTFRFLSLFLFFFSDFLHMNSLLHFRRFSIYNSKKQQQQQQTNQQNNVSSTIRYPSSSFARSFHFQLVSFFTSRGQLHDALLVAQVACEGGISLPPKKETTPLDLKKNDILPSLTNFMTDENKGWAIVMHWGFSAGSKASFMLQITVF